MKKFISILLALVMLMALCVPAMAANNSTTFGTLTVAGEGTEKKPYKITDIDKLRALAYEVNEGNFDFEGKYFALYTSLTGSLETPIGTPDNPFRGNFNGCGNMVTLNINMPNDDYVGMFGYCEGSRIENLDWQGSIIGHDYVGGICGFCDGGSIINCGDIMGISLEKEIYGHYDVGGICGEMDNGTIERCINDATVITLEVKAEKIGGICGKMRNGTIDMCVNNVTIPYHNINPYYVGGICGQIECSGIDEIKNCVNNGDMGGDHIGGICGHTNVTENGFDYRIYIRNCINNGNIIGGDCGGLVGWSDETDFHNCISTGVVSGNSNVGGFVGYNNNLLTLYPINVFWDLNRSDLDRGAGAGPDVTGPIHTPDGGAYYIWTARTTEQMKSAEMLNTLNGYVNDNPDLGLLHWETGASGYPCLAFSTNGTGSTLSEGNTAIIAVVGAVAVIGVAALVIVKKKKKPAVASGVETDEE